MVFKHFFVVILTRFELVAYYLEGSCSIQLSYRTKIGKGLPAQCLDHLAAVFLFLPLLYPGPGSNRHDFISHRILSPACLPIPPPRHVNNYSNS